MKTPSLVPQEVLRAFETVPDLYLILSSDLVILTASNAYLRATRTVKANIIGKYIFDALPDTSLSVEANAIRNLYASLKQVIATRKPHRMALQLYETPGADRVGCKSSLKYWLPTNTPVLDDQGEIQYIIHKTEDMTELFFHAQLVEELENKASVQSEEKQNLISAVEEIGPSGSYEWDNSTMKFRFSENMYQLVVDSTPDVITRWNKDLRLIFANPAFEANTGLNNALLLGESSKDHGLTESIVGSWLKKVKYVFETAQSAEHYSTLSASDREVYFYTRMVPEIDAEGNVQSVLAIARDITPLKKAEQELKESKALLQSVFESSVSALAVYKAVRDKNGELIDLEVALADSITRSYAGGMNLIGKRLSEAYPETVEAGVLDNLLEVVRTGKRADFEVFYKSENLDGWYRIVAEPLGDGLVASAEDITSRKQAERALQEEHRRLKEAQAIGHVGSFEWNAATNTLYWSDEMYRIHGLEPQAVPLDLDWILSLTHPEDLPGLQEKVQRWREEPVQEEIVHRMVRADGKVRVVRRLVQSFAGEDGHITHLIGTVQDITEQVRTNLILDTINEVCFELDNDFNIVYANRKAYQFWQLNSEEVLGKNLWDIFPQQRGTAVEEALQKAFKNHEQVLLEAWSSRVDRWILLNANPSPNGLIVLNFDVTDLVNARKKLEQSEALLRSAEKVVQAGSYELDLATMSFRFSDGLFRLLGEEPQSFVPTMELINSRSNPKDVAVIKRILAQAIIDKQPYHYTRRIQHRNGEWHILESHGNVICDENGNAVKVIGVGQDITERQKAEKEIKKHLALLKQSEEVARMGSWEYDIASDSFWWSEGMYRLFGIEPGKPVKPETYLDFVIEEDRPVAEKIIRHMRTSHEPVEEFLRVKVNGQVNILRVKGVALRNKQGQVEKMLGVDKDISEVKRLEQENLHMRLEQQKALLLAILEAQEEERRRIAESLHNGVGQILYATKLNLEQVAELIPKNGIAQKALQRTEDILTEAIYETRRVSHELMPMLLKEFGLEEALDNLCSRYENSSLYLHCKVEGLQQRLKSYQEIALYRICQELVNNIIKHSKATEASIELRQQEDQVLLQVRDNGTGFSYEDNPSKGLGLRAIQDRVQLLNGTLTISTPKTGKGTLFTIWVPVAG